MVRVDADTPQCFVLQVLCFHPPAPPPPPTPPYIHSVFMSAANKARGSVHAGGGVAANSWQLFKYLLSPLPPFLYIPTLVSVGAATGGGSRVGGEGVRLQ